MNYHPLLKLEEKQPTKKTTTQRFSILMKRKSILTSLSEVFEYSYFFFPFLLIKRIYADALCGKINLVRRQ